MAKKLSIKTRCLSLLVLGLAVVTPVGAADVTGAWTAEFDTQVGIQKYTYTLKQDGDRVTGKANSDIAGEKREVELQEGKLEAETVTFVEVFEFQGAAIRIEYKGKTSGDEIQFIRTVGEFATEQFTAKRAGSAAAAPAPDAAPRRERPAGGIFGPPVALGPTIRPPSPLLPSALTFAARGSSEASSRWSSTIPKPSASNAR